MEIDSGTRWSLSSKALPQMEVVSRTRRNLPRKTQGVCTFWIQGRCNRNPCNFSHSFQTTSNPRGKHHVPCSYFLRDICSRGQACNFLHTHSSSPRITFLTKLKGHQKVVKAITLPNGSKQLFTGGEDQTIRIWDCETGKCTTVNPVGGDIGCLHSESGYLFAGLPNEVRAWNLQTSAEQILIGPVGQVHAISVYNDILLAGVQDGNILAWKFNPATQMFDPVASLGGHIGAVIALEIAENMLFSGSTDKSVRVWDLTSGQCIQVIHAHTHDVTSLIYWQHYLISCSLDGKMKIWEKTQNGAFELQYTYPEDHETKEDLDGILSLCGFMDKEEKPILLCSINNTIRVFEIPSFTEIGMMFSREEVWSLQVGPGGLLFSGDTSGEIKVWKWNSSTYTME